jgi:hypothetical protein
MGALGAIDIPNRNVDDFRAAVKDREAKLANAKKQRDVILNDIRLVSAAIDAGDKQARLKLPALNKTNVEVGRLIVSIAREVSEAKGRLSLAENQAAAASAKRAEADEAGLVRDKWFECTCPDGRKVRHRGASLESLQRALQPGYRVVGQVFGHNEDGAGGFVSTPGAPSMLKALLESQGDVLIEWLEARGIVGAGKTTVVLPPNGRESMNNGAPS